MCCEWQNDTVEELVHNMSDFILFLNGWNKMKAMNVTNVREFTRWGLFQQQFYGPICVAILSDLKISFVVNLLIIPRPISFTTSLIFITGNN